MVEQAVQGDAVVNSAGGPLTPPLPLAGERSQTESRTTPPSTTQARTEDSLLGTVTETAEASPQAQDSEASSKPVEETPARPTYGEFKLPEGVTIDGEALKPATELFAESGLSQEQAQKFIDLAMARETAAASKSVQAFVDLQNQWVSEIKADPDIGGDRLKTSLAAAARAIDRLEVPGLREALNFTGAGNHPAVVRAFVRLGQMIAEDRFRPAPPVAPQPPRSLADVIYDGAPKGSTDGF